jgi:putative lipoic acid-binding regulatory protein
MPKKHKPAVPIPALFTLYVMGRNEQAFEDFIFTLLKGHLPMLQASDLSTRLSRDGNYISVRAVLNLERKEQIDAIYRELYEHERVLMAL